MRINQFFEDILRAKVKNPRWSWGAINPRSNRVFLRLWEDAIKKDGGDTVMIYSKRPAAEQSHGHRERHKHVEAIKNGAQGFGVVCRVLDPNDKPRTIATFEKDALVLLGALSENERGIYARIVKWIPLGDLNRKPRGPINAR